MTADIQLLDSDVEASLRATVRDLLRARCDTASVMRAYDHDRSVSERLWKSMAVDLGLAGLMVPEDRGGAGASAREAAVVMEEMGRCVAPVPFLESSVMATTVLLAGSSALLEQLAAGTRTAVLATSFRATSAGDVRASELTAAGLSSRVTSVAGALDADVLLVPVIAYGGLEVHAVAARDAQIEPVVSLDMTRPLADVTLSGVRGEVVVGAADGAAAIDAALALGAAMLASESAGIAAWCLEETVAYLKQRRQFGRVVGSFQAIKHRLADLYVEVESANATARHAAGAWAIGDPDSAISTAVAASFCSDVAVHAAEEAVQLHGGIGMTWEHPAHLYLKRAKANQIGLGGPEHHRHQLAALVHLTMEDD